MAYAYKIAKMEMQKAAMARVEDINASFKDLCNVCQNVRGRRSDAALEYLSEAADGDRPVRYFRHNKRRGHVGLLGGKKGGWPVKSCRIVRDVLANAMANADANGLGMTKIAHIQANKQHTYPRMSPKGRRIRQDLETAFVEIVLVELEGEAGKRKTELKRPEAKKVDEVKKTDVKVEAKKTDEKKPEVKVEAKKEDEKKAEAKKTEAAKPDVKIEAAKPPEKKADAVTEPKAMVGGKAAGQTKALPLQMPSAAKV